MSNVRISGPGDLILPFELLCSIFTTAAEGDLRSALVLCRVSSTFHELLTPLLYRTVALNSTKQIAKFLLKATDRNKKRVRYLAIRQKYDIPLVHQYPTL